MQSQVRRVFVEKKSGFDVEAQGIYRDLKDNLGIQSLEGLRVVHRYDIEGITDEGYRLVRNTIFSEPPVDLAWDEEMPLGHEEHAFAWEYLPGQYDQRADSAAQGIQILMHGDKPIVRSATVIVLLGRIPEKDIKRIKAYIINPVDSHEAGLPKLASLEEQYPSPLDVGIVDGFIQMDVHGLEHLSKSMGFAMDRDDLLFCQTYFKDQEKRDPTVTELRIVDTYWSDHCRHTTFLTEIDHVDIEHGPYRDLINTAYQEYLKTRRKLYSGKDKPVCLMDIATIAMKEMRKDGKLRDLDESDEINACSIVVAVDHDGKTEEWLVQFKNETHNHPTEIEPFGGAATCLGGAIRDPLSGRAYVYQAMRVTGSGDPRVGVDKTIPGKLPQRKISIGAAHGYSSYGNQIGLATGQVTEIYDDGYVAKRMEIGAVIGAVPKENVMRIQPVPGDVVVLLGGRTGRDGCGGATGSSKAHTEESITACGAEVQKGNPPEERKIQRLFRKPDVTRLIKKCNDFGAGGISVAIGELADGLKIYLDRVPKKYEGLDGTELAISESQERMAVVVAAQDAEKFIRYAAGENLEATIVAEVVSDPSVTMIWRDKPIVHIRREFLNSNGAKKHAAVQIKSPDQKHSPFEQMPSYLKKGSVKDKWLSVLSSLNVSSQKGLVERFDGSIGAGTVLMPFGGKTQLTPIESMVAKIPLLQGDTTSGTAMSFGYNPQISRWSPFHGAVYAIVESLAKIAAVGGDVRKVRLTLQEYFERLGKHPDRWGKPFAALLGAFYTQKLLNIPAIGGKDSMSGSFQSLDVPPTLVSFAVDTLNITKVLSPEFKKIGSSVVYLPMRRTPEDLPDFEYLMEFYPRIHELTQAGKLAAIHSIRGGGVCEAVSKMAFGNIVGFEFEGSPDETILFGPNYGSLVVELAEDSDTGIFSGLDCSVLGKTIDTPEVLIGGAEIPLDEALNTWMEPLSGVFPPREPEVQEAADYSYDKRANIRRAASIAKPRVIIPAFPGNNCEYDSARAFEKAGAIADIFVFRNRTPQDIEESVGEMVKMIKNSQIIMVPGGFSAGDEPEGSGKFIAAVFRNPAIRDATMELLKNRDGLVLGVCNGFQALIKLGLVPYGEIREMTEDSPTLTYNTIGRHMSMMVRTKVVSKLSPWFWNADPDEIYTIPVSHGEGRFVAHPAILGTLKANGQIATQYVNEAGHAASTMPDNPNGSLFAIEGITSPDGRVLGKMAHSERTGNNVAVNIPGNKYQPIFEAGVGYYK